MDGSFASGWTWSSNAANSRSDTIVSLSPFTQEEAQQGAVDAFRRMARRFVIASGVADFGQQLKAGSQVKFMGVGVLFSGIYSLTEVKHLFDLEGGLRTEFIAESANLGTP